MKFAKPEKTRKNPKKPGKFAVGTPALGSATSSENLCHFFIETRCVKDALTSRISRGCSAFWATTGFLADSASSRLECRETITSYGSIGLSRQNVHLKSMVRVPPMIGFETRYNGVSTFEKFVVGTPA